MKNNIRKLIKKSGEKITSIVEKSGVGRTSFYAIMEGSQIPKISTAKNIAKALESSIGEVFPDLKEEN